MSRFVTWTALAGPVWSLVGAGVLPRLYRARRADPRLAGLAGGLWGAALGPLALGWLHRRVPPLRRGPPFGSTAASIWTPSSPRYRTTA